MDQRTSKSTQLIFLIFLIWLGAVYPWHRLDILSIRLFHQRLRQPHPCQLSQH